MCSYDLVEPITPSVTCLPGGRFHSEIPANQETMNNHNKEDADLSNAKYIVSLIQIDGGRHVRHPWPEGEEDLLIGRSDECDITIDNSKVSREHCSITELTENEFLVVDLDSTNGTWYEGGEITEQEISLDEKIQVGNYLLKITDLQWSDVEGQQGDLEESEGRGTRDTEETDEGDEFLF